MNFVFFDDDINSDLLVDYAQMLYKTGFDCIFLPKNLNLLTDVPIEQLMFIKEQIEKAIKEKE